MPPHPLVLREATIYADAETAPVRGTVTVSDGSIASAHAGGSIDVPDDAEILDCNGCTIVAGFWNCHVHFFERKWANAQALPPEELQSQLEDFTRYGFTTVFDLSSSLENTNALRARIASGDAGGPRILTTGEGLISPNGLPDAGVLRVLGLMDMPLPEVANPHDAKTVTAHLLDEGADGIKLFASSQNGGALGTDAMRVAVVQARTRRKPVFAHVNSPADVLASLEAGVDVIGHTTPSGVWDDDLIAKMKEAAVALTPTLRLWKHSMRHDRSSLRDRYVRTTVEQLGAWHRAGGTVLFGTDYGAVDADPTEEYALMHGAGMDFRAILASLTTSPARAFGEPARCGRVAAGYVADLTVLEGDPSMNLSALSEVRYTVRDGKIVYRG